MTTALWFRALAALGLYRRLALFERPIDKAADVALPEGLEGRPLVAADAGAYRALRPDQDPEQLAARLAAGHVCFGTWHAGALVSIIWLARGRYHVAYLKRDLALAPDEAFVYDLYTAPDVRHRGATIGGALALRSYAERNGFARLLAAVLPENTAGLGPPRRFGYRPIGVLGFVGLGPWRRHFCRVGRGERVPGSPGAPEPRP